jgi:hypothetical protein
MNPEAAKIFLRQANSRSISLLPLNFELTGAAMAGQPSSLMAAPSSKLRLP